MKYARTAASTQDEIELAESGVDVSGMVLPLPLTAHHARCSASCSAHRRHGSLCTYSTRLYARFAHAAPPDRPSPPPPCFSRIRPWPISRFAASRGPCCHCSMCFRGAFGIHAQVSKLWEATTASILRVLVGCTHVHWLALYMVTNSVLWMSPEGHPLRSGARDGWWACYWQRLARCGGRRWPCGHLPRVFGGPGQK